jgi:hypothetical protein
MTLSRSAFGAVLELIDIMDSRDCLEYNVLTLRGHSESDFSQKMKNGQKLSSYPFTIRLVPKRGVEPLHHCWYMVLNHVKSFKPSNSPYVHTI